MEELRRDSAGEERGEEEGVEEEEEEGETGARAWGCGVRGVEGFGFVAAVVGREDLGLGAGEVMAEAFGAEVMRGVFDGEVIEGVCGGEVMEGVWGDEVMEGVWGAEVMEEVLEDDVMEEALEEGVLEGVLEVFWRGEVMEGFLGVDVMKGVLRVGAMEGAFKGEVMDVVGLAFVDAVMVKVGELLFACALTAGALGLHDAETALGTALASTSAICLISEVLALLGVTGRYSATSKPG